MLSLQGEAMYTRHINIPKNYNGVRFQRQNSEDIAVKEHRPSYNEGIKSSHSPLYNQKITAPVDDIEQIQPQATVEENVSNENIKEENPAEDFDTCSYEDNTQKVNNGETHNSSPNSRLFSDLPISNILGNINKEDLLLLGLIFLMATEKDGSNNDILTMLSLLLLKHK